MNQHYTPGIILPNLGNPVRTTRIDPESWEPTVLVDVLDPGLLPVLEAMQSWAERGDPPPQNLFFSDAPALPDIVLLCGIPRRNEEVVLRRIAEWSETKTFIIWLVPPGALRDCADIECSGAGKSGLMSVVDTTVLVERAIMPVQPRAVSDCWSVARAARGILHHILFKGLVCVDLFDIKAVLAGGDRRPLVHFSVTADSEAPPNNWWPSALTSRRMTQCMVATIMPDQTQMLLKFDKFVSELPCSNEQDAVYVTTLGFDKRGGNFEAEIYARLS